MVMKIAAQNDKGVPKPSLIKFDNKRHCDTVLNWTKALAWMFSTDYTHISYNFQWWQLRSWWSRHGVMELDGGRSGKQPLKRRPVPLVASPPHSVPAVRLYWDFGTFFFCICVEPRSCHCFSCWLSFEVPLVASPPNSVPAVSLYCSTEEV